MGPQPKPHNPTTPTPTTPRVHNPIHPTHIAEPQTLTLRRPPTRHYEHGVSARALALWFRPPNTCKTTPTCESVEVHLTAASAGCPPATTSAASRRMAARRAAHCVEWSMASAATA
eukprot:365364-Chlamydomonas_euryale.AAC.6